MSKRRSDDKVTPMATLLRAWAHNEIGKGPGHNPYLVHLLLDAAEEMDAALKAAGALVPEALMPNMQADLQDAAYAFRESLVPRADNLYLGRFPMWHGWAIYDAFVAGAAWATRSPLLAKEKP